MLRSLAPRLLSCTASARFFTSEALFTGAAKAQTAHLNWQTRNKPTPEHLQITLDPSPIQKNAPHPKSHATKVLATGRRKASIARVFLEQSSSIFGSSIRINGKPLVEWTNRDSDRLEILKPFQVTKTMGRFNVVCTVKGGGTTGQTGAIRHGIARALELTNPALRAVMKPEKLMTRDSRVVERKKPGRHKARKGFQWVKR